MVQLSILYLALSRHLNENNPPRGMLRALITCRKRWGDEAKQNLSQLTRKGILPFAILQTCLRSPFAELNFSPFVWNFL